MFIALYAEYLQSPGGATSGRQMSLLSELEGFIVNKTINISPLRGSRMVTITKSVSISKSSIDRDIRRLDNLRYIVSISYLCQPHSRINNRQTFACRMYQHRIQVDLNNLRHGFCQSTQL